MSRRSTNVDSKLKELELRLRATESVPVHRSDPDWADFLRAECRAQIDGRLAEHCLIARFLVVEIKPYVASYWWPSAPADRNIDGAWKVVDRLGKQTTSVLPYTDEGKAAAESLCAQWNTPADG